MKFTPRGIVFGVLALDAVVALVLFAGWVMPAGAEGTAQAADTDAAAEREEWVSNPSRESLELIGKQLAARAEDLERRELELEELLRGGEVLARAGLGEPDEADEPEVAAGPDPAIVARKEAAFTSLKKAYENMEPTSAAQALVALADRDKQAVVELLLEWKPRTSGAIMDAMTQTNPKLSADLSYEIWKFSSGKK